MSDLPLRPRSTRLSARTHRYSGVPASRPAPKPTEIFPGLNDVTDALEALPLDIIRYFTLLKEIDAKCVSIIPVLNSKIESFKKLENKVELKEIRTAKIQEISRLIRDVLPCLEEKMHVASIAADKTVSYIDRINDDFELIFKNEIPESIKYGQTNHPAIINDSKIPDNKSAQSQRSESRREALAAKKAANYTDNDDSRASSAPVKTAAKGRKDTPSAPSVTTASSAATTSTSNASKKRKTTSSTPTTSTAPSLPVVNTSSTSNSAPTSTSNNNNSITQALKNEDINISRPTTPSGNKRSRQNTKKKTEQQQQQHLLDQAVEAEEEELLIQKKNSNDEPLYCYCNQVSYGEMVGCDGDDCKREWFHLPCTGLDTLPKGKWYCDDCLAKTKKARKV